MFSIQNILVVSGILLSLPGYSVSQTFTSSGGSGVECGPDGLQCLSGDAGCDKDTNRCFCKRDRFPVGKGLLACYRTSDYFTEIVSDPIFTTFNNKSVDFGLPCRFLISHFSTGLQNQAGNSIGKCLFMVHGFQQKDKGKMYLAGFDVAIQLDYDDGNTFKASFRKVGEASDKSYTYIVTATLGSFLPDGPWGSDAISYNDGVNNVKVKCAKNGANNIMKLDVNKCGVGIDFRAYDTKLRINQTMVPGFTLSINKDNTPVEFLSEDAVMAMIPADQSNGVEIESSLVGLLDRRQTMVYRALTSGVTQNQPEVNSQCEAAADFLHNCTSDQDLKDAFDNCLWMFKAPRFIRCFDNTKSGEPIMELFNNCTAIYCGSTTCQSVIDSINMSGCGSISGYSELTQFVLGNMCPGGGVIGRRRRRRRRR